MARKSTKRGGALASHQRDLVKIAGAVAKKKAASKGASLDVRGAKAAKAEKKTAKSFKGTSSGAMNTRMIISKYITPAGTKRVRKLDK